MCKNQRSAKGLKFGDLQNLKYYSIRMGVIEDAPTCDSLRNMSNYEAPVNAVQYDMLVEENEISEHPEDDIDNITEEVTEENDDEISDEYIEDNSKDDYGGDEDGVAAENRTYEVVVVEETTTQPVD